LGWGSWERKKKHVKTIGILTAYWTEVENPGKIQNGIGEGRVDRMREEKEKGGKTY